MEVMKVDCFRCKECGEILKKGLCGEHRKETNHKKFEAIYEGVLTKTKLPHND